MSLADWAAAAWALEATSLATVPPVAGLVGKLFGQRHLGTLFGLTLLSHQIGGFFGAWTAGLAMVRHLFHDLVRALVAANLPIREAAPQPILAGA